MPEVKEGKPIQEYFDTNINAGVNQLVDSFPITTFINAKWVIALTNLTTNDIRTETVHAVHRQSLNPSYNITDIKGSVSRTLDILLDSGVIKLYIQNDEAVTIKAQVSRESF